MPNDPAFAVNTLTSYSSSDYNGILVDPLAPASLGWQVSTPRSTGERPSSSPGPAATTSPVRFPTLTAFTQATGQDAHSKPVDFGIFARLAPPDVAAMTRVYDPETIDFSLKSESAAIDAAVRLANVNDRFTGGGPDLGAVEFGQPAPHYGPRAVPPRQ